MQRKRATTDLNAPNGSRDIPFQSQKVEQNGRRHFLGFQPHFHLNVTLQSMLQDNEKMKVQCLKSLLFDMFETLQAIRTQQWNFVSFKISLLWQPKSKPLSII